MYVCVGFCFYGVSLARRHRSFLVVLSCIKKEERYTFYEFNDNKPLAYIVPISASLKYFYLCLAWYMTVRWYRIYVAE